MRGFGWGTQEAHKFQTGIGVAADERGDAEIPGIQLR